MSNATESAVDIADLKFFLAAARTGGIGRAASELLTVPSNVSSRIRALEHELGVPLFQRHARGVSLTPAGEQLLPYAERIAQLMRELTQVVRDDQDPSGLVSIGAMESTAGLRLPSILAEFTSDCPRVDLRLLIDTTDALVDQVLNRRLDGAFVCGPVRVAELVSELVFVEHLALVTATTVASAEAALTARRPRILVLRAGCAYRGRLENLFAQRGLPSPEILELATLEGILGCIAAGMGTTLLPIGVVAASPLADSVKVHSLPAADARAATLFIRRADAVVTPAIGRFLSATHRSPCVALPASVSLVDGAERLIS
jgi:DNA-binding transcriptional LysR family regulator